MRTALDGLALVIVAVGCALLLNSIRCSHGWLGVGSFVVEVAVLSWATVRVADMFAQRPW